MYKISYPSFILFVAALLLVVSCTKLSNPFVAVLELESPRQEQQQIYIAASLNTPSEQEITKVVLEQVESQTNAHDFLRIDYLGEDSTQVVYANAPDQQAIWTLIENLPKLTSTERAISSVLYTTVDLCDQYPDTPIKVIFVSEGTDNPDVLTQMMNLSKMLASCHELHVSVVGVSPALRGKFSQGFFYIKDRVQFASSEAEVRALIQSLE